MKPAWTIRCYRVTRPDLYEPGTPGHDDPRARQGHYVDAPGAYEACEVFRYEEKLDADEQLEATVAS